MINIAILMTCYNRKNITLHSLNSLYNSIDYFSSKYNFDIYLVDDSSPDGTGAAVLEKYPRIHIIYGNGSLYWGGGMNLAWRIANETKDYDYYIWYNDDSFLFPNAIELLFAPLAIDQKIVVGGVFSDSTGNPSYGGKNQENGNFISPDGNLFRSFRFLNGNLVLIPKVVFNEIGYISDDYKHAIGDYDYGLRCLEKGAKLVLTSEYVGQSDRHDHIEYYSFESNNPLNERFKRLYSATGPNPVARYKYNLRHYGFFRAIAVFLYMNIRTLIPSILKKK